MNTPEDFKAEFDRFKREFGHQFKFFALGAVALTIGIGFYSSYYTVEPDEEAVVIRLGRYVETNRPGLHFKIPFGIDKVTKLKSMRLLQARFGFRANESQSRSNPFSRNTFKYSRSRNVNWESSMLTGDLNVTEVQWVVQYKISDPFKYLYKTRNPIQNIRDISESIMRRVVGDKLVTEVLTVGRADIAFKAKTLMQEVLSKYDMGITIDSVMLQDVTPPDSVKPSFNEVNAAKQEQEKVINQAEEAYNRVIPEARGKANKRVSEAEGYADALINRAEGDAKKFAAVLREYKKAPAITKKRIYLETMEQVFARLQDITVVDSRVKGLLPVFGQGQSMSLPGQGSK